MKIGDRAIAVHQQPAPDHRADLVNPHVDPVSFAARVVGHDRLSLSKKSTVLGQAREAGLTPLAEIPRTVAVPESANAARSVLAHAPRSAIAQSYREATDAILVALADR